MDICFSCDLWGRTSGGKVRPVLSRPSVINHITFIGSDAEWHTRTFLPLYDMIWAADATWCDGCNMASHCHPMVQDEEDENAYHKLCTLSVIKEKLIKAKEIC